jgi:hypothetical protein
MSVNRKRNYTWHFLLLATLVAAAIGIVNYLSMEHRVRMDLTADKRFTISEGTKRMFERLPGTVTVTYFVSEEPPARRINLERDVRDKLEEISRSSGGRMQYRIERLSHDEMSARRDELENRGIVSTVDVLTAGAEARAEVRGVQDYLSSIEIRHGGAEPRTINGVVNLVDATDEARSHRVDTLEFDIAYTLLTMREDTRRPAFADLLRMQPNPVRMAYYISESLPDRHRPMAASIDRALDEIAQLVPQKVQLERVKLAPGAGATQPFPFADAVVGLRPFDVRHTIETDADGAAAIRETRYYAALIVQSDAEEDRFVPIWSFAEQQSAAEVRELIEDTIWEMVRPRTRLGVLLPPEDPEFSQRRQHPPQPGMPPQNAHTPLLEYVQHYLDYEAVWVDLASERRIPRDIACLIVLEANGLQERELYEVEAYLASGGNVVMLTQAFKTDLNLTRSMGTSLRLDRVPTEPHFEDWMRHLGIELGNELIMSANAKLRPFVVRGDARSGWRLEHTGNARIAPVIEPGDIDAGNVFTRGLTSLPLPLPVETRLDASRLSELGLKHTELIRLRNDAYRFMPADAQWPSIPLTFDITSQAEVERNPDATPADGILAQRLKDGALIAVRLEGTFPGFWADEGRKVPGWDGDPEELDAQPALNPQPGNLVVVSTSAVLNVLYLDGYPREEANKVIIPLGIRFYRNLSEAFLYGDELVQLRARTGVAPRISGPIDNQTRVLWFVLCIAGVPVILLVAATGIAYARGRERARFEATLTGGGE